MEILKFKPIYKETIWGGGRIAAIKGDTAQYGKTIGESWEISTMDGNVSVISGGSMDGKDLREAIAEMKGRLVGDGVYAEYCTELPILVKFIDAVQDLSIQVHPDDRKAVELGYTRGKTEMWYLVDTSGNATIRIGLEREMTPAVYKELVESGDICKAIGNYAAEPRDCFFIPAGTVHSIGAGCLVAEIQQSSDVTFRIYDFDRRDSSGNKRQLHTEEAAASIDYRVGKDYLRRGYPASENGTKLVESPFFNTYVYGVNGKSVVNLGGINSFMAVVCTEGEGSLRADNGETVGIRRGECALVPAEASLLEVCGSLKFLGTYVP